MRTSPTATLPPLRPHSVPLWEDVQAALALVSPMKDIHHAPFYTDQPAVSCSAL